MLKSIRIKGFRSCNRTNVSLEEGVGTLVGRNGVGKTNILRCIEWLAKSAISPSPIDLASAGSELKYQRKNISVCVDIKIDSYLFTYALDYNWPKKDFPQSGGLHEWLHVKTTNGPKRPIFRRIRERIRITGKPTPIRVPRLTPSIAALSSLLPPADSIQNHLQAIKAFFAAVSYYPLAETPTIEDAVHEGAYREWHNTYASEGAQTTSVALRLIYMFNEDKEMLKEFQQLIGPEGLGLIKIFAIANLELSEAIVDKSLQSSLAAQALKEMVYIPVFAPPANMGGGAGQLFKFSDLSAGTRRVIQIVISLLFDKRSLMLVEQPEESIHPGLLRKLIDLLRSYSHQSQILFSTHSPEVLDMLRPEELILVIAQEGQTQARRLTRREVSAAREFLLDQGSLSEFLAPLDEHR